jgi:hypothetical protein
MRSAGVRRLSTSLIATDESDCHWRGDQEAYCAYLFAAIRFRSLKSGGSFAGEFAGTVGGQLLSVRKHLRIANHGRTLPPHPYRAAWRGRPELAIRRRREVTPRVARPACTAEARLLLFFQNQNSSAGNSRLRTSFALTPADRLCGADCGSHGMRLRMCL